MGVEHREGLGTVPVGHELEYLLHGFVLHRGSESEGWGPRVRPISGSKVCAEAGTGARLGGRSLLPHSRLVPRDGDRVSS
jgi:hypothetical protein